MDFKKKWLSLIAAVLLITIFPGCAAKEETKEDPFIDKWRAKVETSRAQTPSATARQVDLPDVREVQLPAKEVKAQPEKLLPVVNVTMTMRNTDVNVILRTLARTADQNIMMNSGVSGITNVNVKDTPWDQVFLGILRTRGLAYKWEGEIIRVMTLEDMEHDQNLEDIGQRQKAQKIESTRVEPLITRIIRVNYTDAKALGENMAKILAKQQVEGQGESSRGSVTVDEHNNALIIHAIRDDIAKMIDLIEELDRPTAQVLIEAHIIETTRATAHELGVQWGGLYRGEVDGNSHWITPGASATGITGQSLNTGIDPTNGLAANFPADFTKNTRGTGGLTLGLLGEGVGSYLINVQLSALEASSKLNILSNPSITTLDNQTAIVESGTEVPFQTIDNQTGNPEIEFKKAALKLEVTPHVIDNKLLKLKIVTSKDELDFTNTVQGNPTIITKNVETNIILLDGQTTVIGGLTKETLSGSEAGAPWIKDIPVLSYLFKGEGRKEQLEEILIFITPHILKAK